MTTCDRCQAWMVEALYGELEDSRRPEFDAHLAGCAECTALLSQLQTTARLMSRRRRPDPGPEFWAGYQHRLEERVAREDTVVDSSRFARRRSLGSWGYRVAAVVALLAVGAWLGRTVLGPSGSETPMLATTRADSMPREQLSPAPVDDGVVSEEPMVAETNREANPMPIDAPAEEAPRAADGTGESAVVLASDEDDASRYIRHSQMLLLAMLNGEPADSVAFDAQKQRAGELVRAASSVREGSDDRRVRELVAQLELILREIAHLEQSSDVDAVEVIRSRVDREGVLLRINVEQMRSDAPRATSGAID
ncbi:MAG TPA: zf-HC2 domain-containing protein [Candidatus Krumholzibacteria bacterium]|nr:zf-HC2 domain-containing protein [Candidatus Krumholzibacteria bacterium]